MEQIKMETNNRLERRREEGVKEAKIVEKSRSFSLKLLYPWRSCISFTGARTEQQLEKNKIFSRFPK